MPVEMSRAEYDAKRAQVAELRAQLKAQLEAAQQMGTTPQQMEATHFADPFDPTAHRLREGDILKLAATANSGAFLGGGDELASALTAVASAPFMDASVADIYRKEQAQSEAEQRDLAERNPTATLAARVGGGLTGGLARIGIAEPIAAALRWAPGGSVVGRLAGHAAEGATTGYLTADQTQDRGMAAGVGALLQPTLWGGLKLATAAGRGTTNLATNNRYQLGDDANFVPLNMAGEGTLPSAYRKVVGTSFGGGPKIYEQSGRVLSRALGLQDEAAQGLQAAKGAAEQNFTFAKNAITDSATQAKILAETEGMSQQQAAKLAKDQAEGLAFQTFRANMLDRSLPTQAPTELRAQVAQLNPVKANAALDDIWQQYGFATIKPKAFTVQVNDLYRAIDDAVDNPGQDMLAAGIKSQVDKLFTRHGQPVTQAPNVPYGTNPLTGAGVKNTPKPTGTIEIGGDALMQVRNNLRTAAANLPEQGFGAAEANALRKAAHAVDNQIEKQLSPAEQTAYRAELEAYGHRRTLDKTVQATPKELFGQFEPVHWLRGAERYSPRRSARGEAPAQTEAEEALRVSQASQRELGDQEQQTKFFLKSTKQQIAADKLKEKRALAKPSDDPAVVEAERVLKAATEQAQVMAKRMPTQDPAYWTRNYNTDLLTTGLGMPSTGPATTAAGTAISNLLGSKTTQRVLAGDTGTQKAISEWLRNSYDPLYKGPVHAGARALLRAGVAPQTQFMTPALEEY